MLLLADSFSSHPTPHLNVELPSPHMMVLMGGGALGHEGLVLVNEISPLKTDLGAACLACHHGRIQEEGHCLGTRSPFLTNH